MDLDKMNSEDIQSVIKLKPQPKQTWEPDVKSMISTKKWLSTYGLRRNRLSLDQILGSIGFKHSDGETTIISIIKPIVDLIYM